MCSSKVAEEAQSLLRLHLQLSHSVLLQERPEPFQASTQFHEQAIPLGILAFPLFVDRLVVSLLEAKPDLVEVFLEQVVSLLDAAPGTLKPINAAIPGYSTFQSINLLEMRALKLKPDVLIIGSLWSDNNFDTFRDRDLLDSYSRFESGLSARVHRAFSPSAVYRVLDYSLRVRRGPQARARKVGWTVGNEGGTEGMRRVGVNQYAQNLDRLVEMAHAIECEVMFLLLAHPMDLEVASGGGPAWEVYRTAMRDTARRHGLPLVDVPQVFSESSRETPELFSDALHPSVLGHALMGEAVAKALQSWSLGESLEQAALPEIRPVYNDTFATKKIAH